ncbi:acid-sensing ion channel 1B-like [Haliotis rufescens]|uniref:acid-sensing ion channel 1B-like n=1 Tax=Haliotis rufescens TaxID=6454 RepID=UPI00201EEC27|nr:acid-sensing ion channel 1B-like [Haliotis rufescens]
MCNLNRFDISQQNLTDTELKYLRLKGDLRNLFQSIDWEGEEGRELEKIDNVKFWEGGAYKEEEMFKYVSFKNINVPPEDLKYNQKQDQRCFTFSANADRDTLESEDTQLNVVVNIMQETYLEGTVYEAGVKVYIDEPDTAPSYSDDAMTGVSVGTTTRIKLTKKEMKYLPTPYNSRGTDCLDTKASDFVNSLDWFKHYSFDGCLHECSNKAAMNACNCTAGWEPQLARVSLRHCSVKELQTCYRPKSNQVQSEARSGKSCLCQYPCEETSYDIQVSSMTMPQNATTIASYVDSTTDMLRHNYLILQIKVASMVVERTEHTPELELNDIFASIGGQIGLFLGASILTITELLELLITCVLASLKSLWARHKLQG